MSHIAPLDLDYTGYLAICLAEWGWICELCEIFKVGAEHKKRGTGAGKLDEYKSTLEAGRAGLQGAWLGIAKE